MLVTQYSTQARTTSRSQPAARAAGAPCTVTSLRLLMAADDVAALGPLPGDVLVRDARSTVVAHPRVVLPYSPRSTQWLAEALAARWPDTHAALDPVASISMLVMPARPFLPDTVATEAPLSAAQVTALVTLGIWTADDDPDGWAVLRADGSVWAGGRAIPGSRIAVLRPASHPTRLHAHADIVQRMT